MSKIDESCPYCETKFSIEFDNEDDELMFCPSCGEELPEFEADEPIDMYHDEEWN
jgi:transcription initiation factor IIE alpha subunit